MLENKVNWIITERCNRNCGYCFAPKNISCENPDILKKLAIRLAAEKIGKVTISGGEPLLVNSLVEITETLHQAGSYVSLHTNGDRITTEKIRELKPFIHEIEIPIDGVDKKIQESMRGKGSLETFKRAYQALNAEDTKIGIHTVVDEQNVKQLETIYNYLKTRNFDSWKIYEINRRIGKNTKEFTPQSVEEETQGLFAQFLLAEEKMHKHKDKRIKFIAAEDKKPYVFLRSNGQISYGAWFSSERKIFGNMFNEPIKRITERITRYIEEAKDSEQFFEGKAELPLFARIYEGNVWTEELEAADQLPKKTVNKILKLEKLYIEHQEARE